MTYEKNLRRALRRHHYRRLQSNRRHHWGFGDRDRMDKKIRGIVANTPSPCSCFMCGNPRRCWGAETLHEVAHADAHYCDEWRGN